MLNSDLPTKQRTGATKIVIHKPGNPDLNEISMNDTRQDREEEYVTKQSPSFLKSDYIVSDVNMGTNNASGGGSGSSSVGGSNYRRSPLSCQSVEEESVRSSSSRVCTYIH